MNLIIGRLAFATSAAALVTIGFTVTPELASADTSDCASDAMCLSGGWNADDRSFWYNTSQGSRLFPEPWAKGLRVGKTGPLFWSREHFSTYGYIYENAGKALPIGFPVDMDAERGIGWIGMNCSACHTVEIKHQGQAYLVDGAASLADFQTMLRDLVSEMQSTLNDDDAFRAFADAVLEDASEDRIADLRLNVERWISYRGRLLHRNATLVAYGYGRLDAVGHILNKVAHTLAPNQRWRFASDGPVSYPFIWNARQQRKLQWNGVVERSFALFENTPNEIDFSGLGRNVGQVIGVFGEQRVVKPFLGTGLEFTSVNVDKLIQLEQVLGKLHSPVWPDAFGAVDRDSTEFADGRALFEANCAACHKHLEPDDLTTNDHGVKEDDPDEKKLIFMQDIFASQAGTDPWMACNAVMHRSESGPLEGDPVNVWAGKRLSAVEPTTVLLRTMVTRNIVKESPDLLKEVRRSFVERISTAASELWKSLIGRFSRTEGPAAAPGDPLDTFYEKKLNDLEDCRKLRADQSAAALLKYKARPLNGIWATAPYLHNGSVPTLRDLLAYPENRPKSFHVGSQHFDTESVGFVQKPQHGERSFEFNVTFTYRKGTAIEAEKVIPGNDNAGHAYGTGICQGSQQVAFEDESAECKAILHYLKAL